VGSTKTLAGSTCVEWSYCSNALMLLASDGEGSKRNWPQARGLREVQNECILGVLRFQSVVRDPCSRPRRQRDGAPVAPARGPAVRSISARAALHAWPRPEMAAEPHAGRKLVEPLRNQHRGETVAGGHPVFACKVSDLRSLLDEECVSGDDDRSGILLVHAREGTLDFLRCCGLHGPDRGVGALWCALPAVLLSIVRSMTSRRDRVRV
jgi:hypothetical protein